MPKLYKNPKLLFPVVVMAALAGLTLFSSRYPIWSLQVIAFLNENGWGIESEPALPTYYADIAGRFSFLFFSLVSLILVFTMRRKTYLYLTMPLAAFFAFVPPLFTGIYRITQLHWDAIGSFFQVTDWWEGKFDFALVLFHISTWTAFPVAILFLILASVKLKSEVGTSVPLVAAQPTSPQVIVGYDTNTGQPIYGNAPTQN